MVKNSGKTTKGFSDFEREAIQNRAKELLLEAKLNKNRAEGDMWPTSFALKKLTTAEEKKIAVLVKKAVS